MKKQVLFFVLMLMPLMVSAQTEINGIYYNLNSTDKVAEVTFVPYGTSYEYTGSIVIPETISYEEVTYSVTSIGEWAFSYCSGLTSITIPSSVTHIGTLAFMGCYGLNSVYITDLAVWCNLVFYKNEESTPSANPLAFAQHLFLNGEEVKELVIPDGVTSIGDFTFSNCKALISVSIPNSVISIGNGAFSGCSGLTSLTIPNSVKSIGDGWDGFGIYGAFEGCSSLTYVTIPDGVTRISDGTFRKCNALMSVSIPNSVTSIGESAFSGCSSLTSVTISNKVTSIGDNAFEDCSGLTSVNIPNSVTSIGYSAFSGCSSLKSVNISDIAAWCNISFLNNPLSDAHHLFLNGEEIKDLVVPNSVTSIGGSTFSGCSGLTSVTIPNSVTSIGNNAFQGCSELSSVSIGKEIKSVGAKAFANCPEIKELYCYANDVPTISSDTFEDSYYIKFATLYVPEASVDLYKASLWSQFGNIVGITGGNEGERCEKPVITLLANGKIKVESATEGATCVTNITASNAEPITDGEISLSTPLIVYTITSYATKEGYDDSEVATSTFRYEKTEGDMNGDGLLNITDVIQLVNMILGQ